MWSNNDGTEITPTFLLASCPQSGRVLPMPKKVFHGELLTLEEEQRLGNELYKAIRNPSCEHNDWKIQPTTLFPPSTPAKPKRLPVYIVECQECGFMFLWHQTLRPSAPE